MKYLSPDNLSRARGLVERSPHKGCIAFVYSVLDKRIGGSVIVDEEDTPQIAVIAAGNTAYLFTEPGGTDFDTLGLFLREYLQSGITDEGVTLWATSPEQVAVLQMLFSLEARRHVFSFPEKVDYPALSSPSDVGYRLEVFAEGTSAFGARLYQGETTASTCYSDLFAGGEAEIQVRTHPDYRRKGLALQVAQRFIEQARADNLRPAWSCDEYNAASCALAIRLGFIPASRLHGYYLHPAFLTWRQNDLEKIGPLPEASTAGCEDEPTIKAADTVLDLLLEANPAQEHAVELLVLPRVGGIAVQLGAGSSWRVARTFPLELRTALTAQLKARAGMHIDRQGFPQRGRFAVSQGTTERIVRLVVSPSEYGEKMLLSVL